MAKRSSNNGETGRVSLAGLPTTALHREIERRKGRVGAIVRRRDRLLAKAARLDAQISELGGPVSGRARGGRRGRGRAGTGLAPSLHSVLDGKTMGVNELMDAVLKSGYQTGAKNFRVMVNATLLKRKDLFKRVGRGQYTTA